MTTPQPKVSVIVRTKDRPQQLEQCLRSIADQNYNNLEVVVINDGGCDISDTIATFPALRCKLLQFPTNVGRTQAANQGLESASGTWISFLDDDDLWLTNHLSYLTEELPKQPAAIYSATKAITSPPSSNKQEQLIRIYNTPFEREQLLYRNFLPIHSVLFHRDIIDQGIRFDEAFDLFEDWDFWLQVSESLPFQLKPEITCIYNLHDQASGVHDNQRTTNAYHAIYQKWLGKQTDTQLHALIEKTHYWHEDQIARLQQHNQNQLNKIGTQHSHALNVIAEKDSNISSLELAYQQAVDTIDQKDQDIEHLAKRHQHALQVVAEKDVSLKSLTSEYEHAISVIKGKDEAAQKLANEYHSAIKQRDHHAQQLEPLKLANAQLEKQLNEQRSQLSKLRQALKTPIRTALRKLVTNRQ